MALRPPLKSVFCRQASGRCCLLLRYRLVLHGRQFIIFAVQGKLATGASPVNRGAARNLLSGDKRRGPVGVWGEAGDTC